MTSLIRVACRDCLRKWATRMVAPSCPRCGSGDVEPCEPVTGDRILIGLTDADRWVLEGAAMGYRASGKRGDR